MGFEDKLRTLCDRTQPAASQLLNQEIHDIASLAADAIKIGKWDPPSIKTEDRLSEAFRNVRFCAEAADAAESINRYLLTAANGRVCDLKISGRHLAEIQRDILNLFDSKQAPRRGFVYVAWTDRPTSYSYVGKASKINRLNLTTHGKLSHAVAHETTVSLLFPSQSEDAILRGIEASVIRLIEYDTGQLPDLNEKRETVPFASASDQLNRLGLFFDWLASSLDPYHT
jgi:hypothetical protein